MSYAIYLGGVRLPVNPESFSTAESRTIKEYDILSQGKVGIAESKSLKTFKWESEFPRANYSYCYKWQNPSVFLDLINDHMKSNEPLELTVSNGTSYGVSCKVVITSFENKEIEAGTYEYVITCKEYISPSVIVENVTNVKRPAPTEPNVITVNTGTGSIYDGYQKANKTGGATITNSDYSEEVSYEGVACKFDATSGNKEAKIVKTTVLLNGQLYSYDKSKADKVANTMKAVGKTITNLAKKAASIFPKIVGFKV